MSSSASPFADDVCLFILEDVGVVFRQSAQEIYELNATATWLWCQMEDGRPLEGLARSLADTFGFDEAVARRHLADTLEAWRRLGFLAAGQAPPPPADRSGATRARLPRRGGLPRSLILALRRRFAGAEARLVKTYCSLGQKTAVIYPTEALMDLIHPALAHIAQSRGGLAPESLIEIEPLATGFNIKRDGTTTYRDLSREQLTPIVQYLAYLTSIERSSFAVAFHAGAVAVEDRVAVLPGRAGNGKTTLTAALLHDGFRYLSDDLLLMGKDLKIEGVPFALGIKDSGVAPLAPYYPELPSLPLHQRLDGKKVRYLSTPLIPSLSGRPPLRLPASWVIFPKFRPGGPTALTPLRKGEALRRLMESSTLALPLTRAQIETFIRWLEAVSCHDLQVNALADAVAAVKSVMTQP